MKDIKKILEKKFDDYCCKTATDECKSRNHDITKCDDCSDEFYKSILEGIVKDVEDKKKMLCDRLDKELNKYKDSHLLYELEVEIKLTKEILSKIYKRLGVEV